MVKQIQFESTHIWTMRWDLCPLFQKYQDTLLLKCKIIHFDTNLYDEVFNTRIRTRSC